MCCFIEQHNKMTLIFSATHHTSKQSPKTNPGGFSKKSSVPRSFEYSIPHPPFPIPGWGPRYLKDTLISFIMNFPESGLPRSFEYSIPRPPFPTLVWVPGG